MSNYFARINFTLVTIIVLSYLTFGTAAPQKRNATGASKSGPALTHQLIIYVDEGHGKPVGHVWIGLVSRDGKTTSYRGFYPTTFAGVPEMWKPGEMRDDSDRVTRGAWNVKRLYNITEAAYQQAIDAIDAWENRDQRRWTLLTHCGDFTEGIARAAGVGLDLPWTIEGKTRPAVFGDFLRKHGGVVNQQQESPEPVATDDESNADNRRAERGELTAYELVQTTSNLSRATFTNTAEKPMSVTIGGAAEMNFTVPPGSSKTVDITPGLSVVIIFSADNSALPADSLFNFKRGKWYKFSHNIFK